MRYLFYAFLLFTQVACGQIDKPKQLSDTVQTRVVKNNLLQVKYTEDQYVTIGTQYIEKGAYKKALEMYNKAIEINSDYINAYLERAICYRKMYYFTKAIADLELVLKKDTDNPLAYSNLANVFFRNEIM